jgi:hypothetical protein
MELIQEINYNCKNQHLISHNIMSIKVFNKIPVFFADIVSDKKHFILTLKKYWNKKSFYSLEDFIND